MTERTNRANAAMKEKGYAFGTNIGLVRNPAVIRYIAEVGFDFVTIDMEHSSFGWETVSDLIQVARASGVTPIIRLEQPSRESIGRAFDLGALGVMVHDVEHPAQVDEVRLWVDDSKFAGRVGDSASTRAQLTVIVQIESREAVEKIDSILGRGGVDVVNVGRGDLSLSLGHPLDRDHREVLDALDAIVEGCKRNGVQPGMAVVSRMDEEEVRDVVRRGFTWITFGTDKHILRRGFADGVRMLQEASATEAAP